MKEHVVSLFQRDEVEKNKGLREMNEQFFLKNCVYTLIVCFDIENQIDI